MCPSPLSSGSPQLQAFSFLSEAPGAHCLYVESQCRQVATLTPLSWKCALKAYFSVISQVFR